RDDKINVPARFASVISNCVEVVECVLQNLSGRDFMTAAKVNTVWCKEVSRARHSRTRLECEQHQEEEIAETNNPFATTSTLDQLPTFCLCIASFRLQERLGGYLSARKMLQKSLPPTCGNLLVTDASYQQQVEVAKVTFPGKVRGFEFRPPDGEVDIQVDGLSFLLQLFGDASPEAKQAMDKFVLRVRRICKQVNHVLLPTMVRSREEIAARIRQLPNKNCAQSVFFLFSENQRVRRIVRFCKDTDEEEIRAHLPDTPLVRLVVADMLLLASDLEDPVQMQSSVSGWRWELPPLFVCDKRATGPGLALLLSRPLCNTK
ncbi:hypothetical protein B566_EDAN005026, partial [Ephemera danica]